MTVHAGPPPVPAAGAPIERRFHLDSRPGRRGGFRRIVRPGGAPPPPAPAAPPPLVAAGPPRPHPLARRMAMAIRCQQLIDAGVVTDQADLADAAGMTRAWITVIMRLNLLAPDLQEALLFLAPGHPLDHRSVDRLTRLPSWAEQRRHWQLNSAMTYINVTR